MGKVASSGPEVLQRTARLCKQVEKIRLARNVSQSDLALAAGVSRSTITRLTNTGKGISLDSFIGVLDALQLGGELDRLLSLALDHSAGVDDDGIKRQRAR